MSDPFVDQADAAISDLNRQAASLGLPPLMTRNSTGDGWIVNHAVRAILDANPDLFQR